MPAFQPTCLHTAVIIFLITAVGSHKYRSPASRDAIFFSNGGLGVTDIYDHAINPF